MKNRQSIRFLSLSLCIALFLASFTSAAIAAPSRSLVDRADDLKGPQIHLIYLVPADGADRNWDTSGQFKIWIDSANNWLQGEVGRKLRFDLFQGDPDVTYLKSKNTLAQLQDLATSNEKSYDFLGTLLREFFLQSPQTSNYLENPKTYMFVIGEVIISKYCGLGYTYSGGIVWTGGNCWNGPQDDTNFIYGMSPVSAAIIHEAFHTYGVRHVCDSGADLMWGVPDCPGSKPWARAIFDINRDDYFGFEKAGTDVSKLTIWTDGSGLESYGKRTPEKTYAWTRDGKYIFTLGGSDQSISWSWSKDFYPHAGSYTKCSIQGNEGVIEGVGSGPTCKFSIPMTWRAGQILNVSAKVASGPYSGSANESVSLLNPDGGFSPCTSQYCFLGQQIMLRIDRCYGADSTFELQQFSSGQWRTIATPQSEANSNCSGYLQPKDVPITFSETGAFIYRWLVLDKNGRVAFKEKISALQILPSNSEYPNADKVAQLVAETEPLLLTATQQAEVDLKARELLSNQLLQCSNGVACYVNQKYKSIDWCFSGDFTTFTFQVLSNGKWDKLFSGPGIKNDPACSANTTRTPRVETMFTTGGLQVIRWTLTRTDGTSFSQDYGLVISDLANGIIAQAQINEAQSKARSLAKIADTPTPKSTTITCVKGKVTKKVTAIKPGCPKGYTKK